MKTIQIIIGLIAGIYLSIQMLSTQYDNHQITQHNQLKVMNIEDIEKHGIGESRYIEINLAITTGSFVYYYNKETNGVVKVIYPIFSMQKLTHFANEDNATKVKVVVVDDNPSSNCVTDNNCVDTNRTTVRGITIVGWNTLDEGEKGLLNSLEMKLEEDLVILRLDSKPNTDHEFNIGAVLFALGLLVFIFIFVGIYIRSLFKQE